MILGTDHAVGGDIVVIFDAAERKATVVELRTERELRQVHNAVLYARVLLSTALTRICRQREWTGNNAVREIRLL